MPILPPPRSLLIAALIGGLATPGQAASHREAPLTAIDRTADITDFYAFRSPDRPDTATSIISVPRPIRAR